MPCARCLRYLRDSNVRSHRQDSERCAARTFVAEKSAYRLLAPAVRERGGTAPSWHARFNTVSSPLKVLALLTDGLGTHGGIGRYNAELLVALSQSRAVSQVLVLPRFGTVDAPRPVGVTQLDVAGNAAVWSLRATKLALQRTSDVIFCGHLNAAPFAAWLARLTGRRLWIQTHGIEAWEPRNSAFRHALAQARLITAVSRFTRNRLLQWSDADPASVRVLPNTIVAVTGRRDRPHYLVERHGLGSAKIILTVGRLAAAERYKGHDRILAALSDVVARVPSAKYLIVGAGEDRQRLQALANEAGTADRVIFAGGVPGAELDDYFQVADVFAMPSTGEGFGIVFLEAAASGLPVIGGNGDGTRDALADGAIGTMIDPRSRGELVEALVAGLEGRLPSAADAVKRFQFDHFANHVDKLVRQHL